MNDINEIDLEKVFTKKLGMRSSAKKLFTDLDNSSSEVVLNFQNIEFMSRSFAQEYLYQKKNSRLTIVETNMSDFIKGMFGVVEKDFEETLGY